MRNSSREDAKQLIENVTEIEGRLLTPGYVWVVYAGTESQQAQAAFTDRKYAEKLAGHMIGTTDPVLREQNEVEAMDLVVDQYKEQVSAGKMPFEIILNHEGAVFDSWGPDDGIPVIEEPVLMNEKHHTLAGTFWGSTRDEAIENAQRLFRELTGRGEVMR
nr:hypothetical protein [uncultured Dyadobacter sp.]